ncbi:MAG: hypothetical protein ACJ8G1_08550, partial [Vitreoscilla sp.]
IQYSDLRSQTTVNAQYDKDGKLICVIKSNAAGLNIVERIATTDENYKDEAAKLGKIYNVPVFDPVVAAVKNGLSPKGNLSAQDAKGDVGLTSTVAQTAATAKADLRH